MIIADKKADNNGVRMELYINLNDMTQSYKKFFGPDNQELSAGTHEINGFKYEVKESQPRTYDKPALNEAQRVMRLRRSISKGRHLHKHRNDHPWMLEYVW